jgi:ABC-type transport system involved in cytochrome c biogenesis permease subunit
MQSKLLKILSYGAVAAVIGMMMAGTVIEKLHGTDAAAQAVYHHPVFFTLWAVTAVAGMAYLLRCSGKRPVVVLLHVAFLLILAGALVTHLSGESGSIHLREGETLSAFEADDGRAVELPFSLRLESFDIEYYPDSRMPSDYISVITYLPSPSFADNNSPSFAGLTGESPATISMNHIGKRGGYRFYQADYDEDGAGSILAVSHDPWGVGITYAGYLLLLACMIAYFFDRNSAFRAARAALRKHREPGRKRKIWTWVLVGGSITLLVLWLVKVFPKGNLMPVLRSPLLVIHVVPIIVSYTLFALTTVLGIIGVLLPAEKSERMRSMSLSVLYPAVFLLTFGTFLGGVWANISWGNYWSWDPKETWALVTLMMYSFPLHGDALPVFRNPRFFHAFCIVAFLAVLVTYYGVNLLLGGIHSYA